MYVKLLRRFEWTLCLTWALFGYLLKKISWRFFRATKQLMVILIHTQTTRLTLTFESSWKMILISKQGLQNFKFLRGQKMCPPGAVVALFIWVDQTSLWLLSLSVICWQVSPYTAQRELNGFVSLELVENNKQQHYFDRCKVAWADGHSFSESYQQPTFLKSWLISLKSELHRAKLRDRRKLSDI